MDGVRLGATRSPLALAGAAKDAGAPRVVTSAAAVPRLSAVRATRALRGEW